MAKPSLNFATYGQRNTSVLQDFLFGTFEQDIVLVVQYPNYLYLW